MIGIRRSNLLTSALNQMIGCAPAEDIPSLRLELMEALKADVPLIVIVHTINNVTILVQLKLNLKSFQRIHLI